MPPFTATPASATSPAISVGQPLTMIVSRPSKARAGALRFMHGGIGRRVERLGNGEQVAVCGKHGLGGAQQHGHAVLTDHLHLLHYLGLSYWGALQPLSRASRSRAE